MVEIPKCKTVRKVITQPPIKMEATDIMNLSEAELCFEIDKRESYNLMRLAEIESLKKEINLEADIIQKLKDQLKLKKALAA